MYVFAEPVTEEQADRIQTTGDAAQKNFARTVVGIDRDDPKVQAAWQNIQDQVDEQVDEDQTKASTSKANEDASVTQQEETTSTSEISTENASTQETESGTTEPSTSSTSETPIHDASTQETESGTTEPSSSSPSSEGPLMGWTLTVRSKVNGGYVDRPEDLTDQDDWKIEYHIQDIPEKTRRRLYNSVKERRRQLIGLDAEEVGKGLKHYRELIQRYSDRGREWRRKQDEINEAKGVQLYKPLGPGSEVAEASAEDAGAKKEILECLPSMPS